MKMTEEMYQKFEELSCDLSPENLCCDGECSRAETNRRYKAIIKEWHKLEKTLGRNVSEDEIFKEQMKRWDKENPINL